MINKGKHLFKKIEKVCSLCIGDEDLKQFIVLQNQGGGCDACNLTNAPSIHLDELCRYIEICLSKRWGLAVEQLPYSSSEGGYIGSTWSTLELVFSDIGLELPRDESGVLFDAFSTNLIDEVWCDWDWLSLDNDVSLKISWKEFCKTVKHERRFFFQNFGVDDREMYSPIMLLKTIAQLSESSGLIRDLPAGTVLWRARTDIPENKTLSKADFYFPPIDCCMQSNRMNPPGISFLYLSSSSNTAKEEVKGADAKFGKFLINKSLKILDLRTSVDVPGIFSPANRDEILGKIFLKEFAKDIMVPVQRDQRVHIEYLPSQVVTEFLRDYEFSGGRIQAIAYGSVVDPDGWNLAVVSSEGMEDYLLFEDFQN